LASGREQCSTGQCLVPTDLPERVEPDSVTAAPVESKYVVHRRRGQNRCTSRAGIGVEALFQVGHGALYFLYLRGSTDEPAKERDFGPELVIGRSAGRGDCEGIRIGGQERSAKGRHRLGVRLPKGIEIGANI